MYELVCVIPKQIQWQTHQHTHTHTHTHTPAHKYHTRLRKTSTHQSTQNKPPHHLILKTYVFHRYKTYGCTLQLCSWWWVQIAPETCRAKLSRSCKEYSTSSWTWIKHICYQYVRNHKHKKKLARNVGETFTGFSQEWSASFRSAVWDQKVRNSGGKAVRH
jgi:hypothetical protein